MKTNERANDQIQNLPVADLVVSPLNPRKTSNKTVLAELQASVKEHGIITPLIGIKPNGHVAIIVGSQRLATAKALKLETVPVIVRDYSPVQAREIANLENVQRSDVHPMEEALSYRELLTEAGYDSKALAKKIGKPETYIYRRLVLCNLIPAAQEVFLEGRMVTGIAERTAALQPAQQEQLLATFFKPKQDAPSINQVVNWIQHNLLVVLKDAPFKLNDKELVPAAGACLDCQKRTAANQTLWPETNGQDRCLDPKCFDQKTNAFLDAQRAKLAKSKNGFVEISEDYAGDETTLGSSKYTIVEKGECPSAKPGLVTEAYSGRVGAITTVCVDPECKVHRAKAAAGSGARSDERKKIQQAETDTAIRGRVLDGILARFTEIDKPLLEQLCLRHTKDLTGDEQRLLWKRRGWEIPKGHYGHPPDSHLPKTFAGWTEKELWRYLLEITLVPSVKVVTYSGKLGKYDDELFALAKRMKVPADTIQAYCKAADKTRRTLRGKAREEALAKLKQPDPLTAKPEKVTAPGEKVSKAAKKKRK